MKYDFTTVYDRRGMDALAVDALGQPGAERTAALGQPDAMRPACSRPAVLIEPDRRAAIRRTVLLADQPGDVVLIAGKGHETYQIFADRTDHFDDREELISWGS